MRGILILILFLGCNNKGDVAKKNDAVFNAVRVNDITRLELSLRVNTDSIKSLVSQLKVLKAANLKINTTLAKKDTIWLEGFGGYGTKIAPYNLRPVKNDAQVQKRNITDIKVALSLIRSDISVSKARLGLLEKNVSNLLAALAAIRQDIAELKAKH